MDEQHSRTETSHCRSWTDNKVPRRLSPRRASAQQRSSHPSVFLEIGHSGEDAIVDGKLKGRPPACHSTEVYSGSDVQVNSVPVHQEHVYGSFRLPVMSRLLFIVVALIALLPSLNVHITSSRITTSGAEAAHVRTSPRDVPTTKHSVESRSESPTEVCKRWAHMSAVVNGTLYIYGGQATTDTQQSSNTWNNNFLSVDLTRSWQISSPSLTGLPQPSGPPAVQLGYLWNTVDSLWLYGGSVSDDPPADPPTSALWSYSVTSQRWTEHANPKDNNGQQVQRAAEGAGISVPNLGRGYYLGGHLDGYTVQGWSQSVPRVYLQSTLEITMPGYSNAALSSTAGSDGAYRNVSANSAGFPQRADGVLIYVPGYGDMGLIIGLAGGTNETFTQMNIIDVYDIASSTWYKQATSGSTPKIRVNPCAVAVSAADGSSTQIHLFGGQSLVPYNSQVQYNDMWILSLPSFTWIEVDQTGQSVPPARAGHTCNIWNAQMVVVGGFVSKDISCDSPGTYVFNTSALTWQNQYNSAEDEDQLNRQSSQRNDPNALQGSYGYLVPALVQSQIGGNSLGSATLTQPAQSATQGPLVTGRPISYTVTGSGATASPTTAGTAGHGGSDRSSSNTGAIVAGVIAGILALVAAYLAFCVWLYRKQLKVYKNHVAMAQHNRLSYDASHAFMLGADRRYSDKDGNSGVRHDTPSTPSGHSSTQPTTTSNVGNSWQQELNSRNPYRQVSGEGGHATAQSSTEDLLRGQEPSFFNVVLNPRRSLRVVNRD